MNKHRSLVLFDIDGTLMRGTGPHHQDALTEGIFRVTGLRTNLDGISTHGMLDGDLLRTVLRAAGRQEKQIETELSSICLECQAAYLERCAEDLRPFVCVGVREILKELHQRQVALGVVTGNLSIIGWKKLELAGLRSHFSFGAFAEDGDTRADLARIARNRALKITTFVDEFRTSLIGDHPNDIAAGKANGFQSIGVATGITPFEELQTSEPDITVHDLRELDVDRLL